jgi:hypothetical protein
MQFSDLIQEIIFYSIINSFVVFGIVKTLKKLLGEKQLHKAISVGITYFLGIIMGFLLKSDLLIWEKILFGFFISSCSVAVYKSAIQTLLNLIPFIVNKFFGNIDKEI